MIVLGLSGLPQSQHYYLRTNPDVEPLDRRICQGMDSAACLIADGDVVAAVAEERFTGDKATGAFPAEAIEYCLEQAGIRREDVDAIAHGFNYDAYRRYFHTDPEYFRQALSGQTMIDELTRTGWHDVPARFRPVDHHLAHAASAYYASGFDDALSIVSDGMGEIDSLTVHRIVGGSFERLHRQGIDMSFGILYSIVTRFLGYVFNSDEYKVMGLSAYGDPTRFAPFFDPFITCEDGATRVVWPVGSLHHPERGYPDAMRVLEAAVGVPRRRPGDELLDVHADIAAAFQHRFGEVLTQLAEHWLRHTAQDSLCLAGGTFLNCLANQSIGELPEVRRVFVTPAAGDDGTAAGAALAVAGRMSSAFTPYTGPAYEEADARKALTQHVSDNGPGLDWEYLGVSDEYLDEAARDLAHDRIIGWFGGRMEFGPRALGNRSILALPGGEDIKDRLNMAVKLRESFRPFAPAILDSDYDQVFDTPLLEPAKYMLSTSRTRPEMRSRIAGAVHVDGSARVQVVSRDVNETFWKLLQRVKQHTGLGCVINTSFNVKNQPIIMRPDTAIEGFVNMGLDRLYIEGFRVSPAAHEKGTG